MFIDYAPHLHGSYRKQRDPPEGRRGYWQQVTDMFEEQLEVFFSSLLRDVGDRGAQSVGLGPI